MELTKRQLIMLIGLPLWFMVCNINHVITYVSWLVNDSKIPTFMIIMIIVSMIIMTITLISEIHIKIEGNIKVKEKSYSEIPNRFCNE